MILFEIGSAVVVGVGMKAKQDAWIAILLGMLSGMILFLVYGYLYRSYPGAPLTSYLQEILGRWLGGSLAFFYILYFLYIASRVFRDFTELLIIAALHDTPMLAINLLMIFIIMYGVYLGIEVLGRASEIFIVSVVALGALGMVFIFASNVFIIENLQPVLENGWNPVLTTAFPLTFTFPFGEMIVFTMLLPFLNHPKLGTKVGLLSILISGLMITFTIAVNIGVLGATSAAQSTFPLLETVGKVNVGNFIQRIDPVVIVILIIGGFFKIVIFVYAAVVGVVDLFHIKKPQSVLIPVGAAVLITSITIASNFVEHIEIGLEKVPYYLHLPFQAGIPLLLLIVTIIRKNVMRQKSSNHVNQEES